MKKIIILNASMRKSGFCQNMTRYLEDAFFSTGLSFDTFHIAEMALSPCDGCGFCTGHLHCKFKDDYDAFFDALSNCNGLVVLSPIYFAGVPAYFKALIDRGQWLWEARYTQGIEPIERKQQPSGFCIFFGGAPKENTQFTGARHTVEMFFKSLHIEPASFFTLSDTDQKNPLDLRDMPWAKAVKARLVSSLDLG